MKKSTILRLLLLALSLGMADVELSARARIIEGVRHGEASTHLRVERVEINEEYTQLDMVALHLIHYWTQLDSDPAPRIVADDGKVYAFQRIEGYEFDKHMVTPLSGYIPFRMYFEPLPKSVKYFDLIVEGDAVRSIPTSAKLPMKDYLSNVPKSVIRNTNPNIKSWPEPKGEAGYAEVVVNVMGETPINNERNRKFTYVNDDFVGSYGSNSGVVDVPESGQVRFVVPIYYGFSRLECYFSENMSRPFTLLLVPGSNEFWIDMARFTRSASYWKSTGEVYVWGDNELAPLMTLLNSMRRHPTGLRHGWFYKPLKSMSLAEMEALSINEIATAMADEFTRYADSIDRSPQLSPIEKRAYKLLMVRECYEGLYDVDMSLYNKYVDEQVLKGVYDFTARKKMPLKYLPDKFESQLDHQHVIKMMNRITSILDHNSISQCAFWDPSPYYVGPELECCADDTTHVLMRRYFTRIMCNELHNDVAQDYDSLHRRQYPNCYPEAVAFAKQVAQANRLPEPAEIKGKECSLHDLNNNKTMDTLAARYKDNVAVVLVYQYYNAPNRDVLYLMERDPKYGKAEYVERGVRFVHVSIGANPKEWRRLVADIEGDHYNFLNSKMQFDIFDAANKSIPSAILLRRDGKWSAVDKSVLDDAEAFRKAVDEMLDE